MSAPLLDRAVSTTLGAEFENRRLAELLRAARTRAKLTQRQLAKLAGTTQPVIARLESATYKGHSLGMLQRIAAALGCDLELRFARRGKSAHPGA